MEPQRRPVPDWPTIHRELRRPGVTLMLLREEYRSAHPEGLAYTWFCTQYGERLHLNGLHVIDEERLKALDDAQVVSLFRSGALAWIEAHRWSLARVGELSVRFERCGDAPPPLEDKPESVA